MQNITPKRLIISRTDSIGDVILTLPVAGELKRMFPDKQIVLLTPIHRSDFHANENNWQCDESYTNRCGVYLDEYIKVIKEAGDIWAVPVINWSASCGLFPLISEHGRYFHDAQTDLLHPNDLGQQRMARTLMYQLLTLPCVF